MTYAHSDALQYQGGFGNQFASEAVAGALPVGRNSPQMAPHGLYAELFSGTAFTAPRDLHAPAFWKFSHLKNSGPPHASLSRALCSTGVR